jgi:hypothetical protein
VTIGAPRSVSCRSFSSLPGARRPRSRIAGCRARHRRISHRLHRHRSRHGRSASQQPVPR